jgi:hypothetical protein
MACPFFLPTEKFAEDAWLHRAWLPLGDGWRGLCTAPGQGNAVPSDEELKDFCNLGYPHECKRFPATRHADSVRFCISHDRADRIEVCYICELEHRPAEHGTLEFDIARNVCSAPHPDARIQKMAACYLEAYLLRRPVPVAAPAR